MMTIRETPAHPSAHQIRLDVRVAPTTVTIGAGPYRVCGRDGVVASDTVWEYERDDQHARNVTCALAVKTDTDETVLLLDDVPDDGVSRQYRGGLYKLLWSLFDIQIPAGCRDLTKLETHVTLTREVQDVAPDHE